MAKFKLEYSNVEFRNGNGVYLSQSVFLERLNDHESREDFIATASILSGSDNHPSNSKKLTIERRRTISILPETISNRKHGQDLIKLHEMILDLIKTNEPIVLNEYGKRQELNLTAKKEQEIENIYQFAKTQEIQTFSQLTEHGFFAKSHTQRTDLGLQVEKGLNM